MNYIGEAYNGIISESFYGDKIVACKKWLDDNFVKSDMAKMGEDGFPTTEKLVTMVDQYKNPLKSMTDVQLFYMMQERFKRMFGSKEERDRMLKQIIKDWYHNRISKYGCLTRY